MKMVAVIERLKDLYPGTGKGTGEPGGNTGLWALYKKEMGDNIHSRRFLLILALVVIAGFASLYGALGNISSAAEDGEFIFLKPAAFWAGKPCRMILPSLCVSITPLKPISAHRTLLI